MPNARAFAQSLDRYRHQVETDANDLKKEVAGDILVRAVERTPVDTGHLKSNWGAHLGASPNPQEIEGVDPSGADTIRDGLALIEQAQPGQDITIANATAYARPIEDGHSQQAPRGVLALAILDAVR